MFSCDNVTWRLCVWRVGVDEMCHVKVDGDDEGCHHDEDEEGGVHLGHGLGVKPRHVCELGVDKELPGETLQ